ncbi:MAG TPA: hypothetical protein VK324_10435, partial [Tepidisphaeraceae bacterium]|nr:hypothetical protein [Tepidisphaeraceae bacterium]
MPGWTTTSGQEWPPVAGTRIGAYPYISQLWRAVTERERALGNARWPFAYHAWYEGTVGSITTHADGTHTVTDPDAVGWVASYTCDGVTITAAKRWTGYANRCSPAPSSYDLIIEGNGPDDHEQIVHVQITDNDATTLTTSSALDWVTAGYVPSIASLAGKRYFIIKRGGWWHHERWPQPPNDQERENGTGTGGTVVVAGVTYSTLTDAALAAGAYGRRPWALDQFAGSDLLVYAGGPLRRATIVGNTADTLRFAHQTWTASGPYSVAAAGGRAFPGRYRFGPFAWYGGATDQRLSHLPNDNLGSAPVPAASMRFAESFLKDGECVATARPAFDVDVWSNWQNFCAPGELNYSRWLYATIRGLQAWVEQNAANFIPPVDYDGAPVLPRFNRATLFAHCSINSGASTLAKGTVAGVPDTFYFTVPATYAGVDTEGRPVHWCVQYAPPAGVPNTLWYDGTGPVTGGRVAVTGGADAHLASTV